MKNPSFFCLFLTFNLNVLVCLCFRALFCDDMPAKSEGKNFMRSTALDEV